MYLALVLLFEAAIVGVFTSLNLIVFYVFWELVMIPMFFFIGVWGGDRRRYAAVKFMIFIFVGSTVMLLAFLAVYFGVSPSYVRHPEPVREDPGGAAVPPPPGLVPRIRDQAPRRAPARLAPRRLRYRRPRPSRSSSPVSSLPWGATGSSG